MKWLLPLAVTVLLGACAGPGPTPAVPYYRQVRSPVAAEAAPARPTAPPTMADLGADPGRFRGMSAQDLTGLLGEPDFRRREKPAEIWQYYGQGCVLDLFLYDDNAVKRVSHAELRGLPSCLPRLLDGHKG